MLNLAAEIFSHSAIRTLVRSVLDFELGIRPGLKLTFLLIPKVSNGVEVQVLGRLVKLFHTKLGKLFLIDLALWSRALPC